MISLNLLITDIQGKVLWFLKQMCGAGRMLLNSPAQPMKGKGESISNAALLDQCQQAVNAPHEFRLHPGEERKRGCFHKTGLWVEGTLT